MTRSIVLLITAVLSILLGGTLFLLSTVALAWAMMAFPIPMGIMCGEGIPVLNLCALPMGMLLWVRDARVRRCGLGTSLVRLIGVFHTLLERFSLWIDEKGEKGSGSVAVGVWCVGWLVFGQNAAYYFLNN